MAQNAQGGLLANGSTEIPGADAATNQTPPNLVKDFGAPGFIVADRYISVDMT